MNLTPEMIEIATELAKNKSTPKTIALNMGVSERVYRSMMQEGEADLHANRSDTPQYSLYVGVSTAHAGQADEILSSIWDKVPSDMKAGTYLLENDQDLKKIWSPAIVQEEALKVVGEMIEAGDEEAIRVIKAALLKLAS